METSCNSSAKMIDLQKYRLPKKGQQKEGFMNKENQNQALEPEQEKDYLLSEEENEDDEPSFDELAFNKKPARKEKKEFTVKISKLKEEEEKLKGTVTKLQDPDYVARYAREKYLFSKDGEIIIRIPD